MRATEPSDPNWSGQVRAACVAEPDCLPTLLQALEAWCLERGLSPDARHDLRLIAEEACRNVIAHAYPPGAPGPLELRAEAVRLGARRAVRLTVEDQGRPFDPLSLPPPALGLPLEQRPIGGLGVHLIRSLSDEQRYRRDPERGNVLVVVKHLAAPPPGR